MRHVWIRNYRCISQCVEQTADRVHRVADPSFGPAVVQHGSLLVGAQAAAATATATAAATAAGTAATVPAVGALGVPVTGGAAATAARAAAPAAEAAGHGATRCTGRRMIVVVRAITVAPGRRAHVGPRSVRERRAPVTGTARAAGRVAGPRIVVPAPGQAARGRRCGGRGRRHGAAAGRRRGQPVVATDHGARHAPGRARPRLRVRVKRTRLRGPQLVAPGRRVRVTGRAPGRRRLLALLPPALRVQLLLLHGAHHAHGQPERGRVMAVRPERVHTGRARGQLLVPQRLPQRVETARLRAVRYVTAVRVTGQYVLQVNVVPGHTHRVQSPANTAPTETIRSRETYRNILRQRGRTMRTIF